MGERPEARRLDWKWIGSYQEFFYSDLAFETANECISVGVSNNNFYILGLFTD